MLHVNTRFDTGHVSCLKFMLCSYWIATVSIRILLNISRTKSLIFSIVWPVLHVFIDNCFIFSAKSKCLCLQAWKVMFVKIIDIFIHFIVQKPLKTLFLKKVHLHKWPFKVKVILGRQNCILRSHLMGNLLLYHASKIKWCMNVGLLQIKHIIWS